MTLLLASRSAARRQMLQAAGVDFVAVAAPLDEDDAKAGLGNVGAEELARRLAGMKAAAVRADGRTLVLGADQTLERADGTVLGKPTSLDAARDQLLELRGADHRLHSAAALVRDSDLLWEAVETVTLSVRPFSAAFLDAYVEQEGEQLLACAGSYRIEGLGAQLFSRIEGSHFAILGLPLLPLLEELRRRGILTS